MTLSKEVIEYISTLEISQGPLAGQLFTVQPWEKTFIQGCFKPDTDTAALSIARGNGKTTLMAGVACATLADGPLAIPRGETILAASSFMQAKILFEHCEAFLTAKRGKLSKREWRILDSPQQALIEHRETKTRVRCLGSDPKRAHGLAPALIICDEPAQWPTNTGEKMVAALRTSAGKQERCLFLAIGTRPASNHHWFQKMLDGGADFSRNYTCSKEDKPFLKKTWLNANPSMKLMPHMERKIKKLADDAKRDPSMLASFKSLYLNMGTSDVVQTTLLDADVYEQAEGYKPKEGSCVWGVDLGTSSAQSAIAAYWPASGRLEIVAAFPTEPDLGTRGLRDGVGGLYRECARRGELIQTGGHTTDVKALLTEAFTRFGKPSAIVCDRWREAEMRDCLKVARIPLTNLEIRGQGFKDGAEDVRIFRRAFLEGKVTPLPSLLMATSMSEARCISDPAGNEKLAKGHEGDRRLNAKDDAVAASIIGVSLGIRRKPSTSTKGAYIGIA